MACFAEITSISVCSKDKETVSMDAYLHQLKRSEYEIAESLNSGPFNRVK
jgi:hypothetical protein